MAGWNVDLFKCIELFILFVSNLENLTVLTPPQLLKDLVVPQSAAISHVILHFILFMYIKSTYLFVTSSI